MIYIILCYAVINGAIAMVCFPGALYRLEVNNPHEIPGKYDSAADKWLFALYIIIIVFFLWWVWIWQEIYEWRESREYAAR